MNNESSEIVSLKVGIEEFAKLAANLKEERDEALEKIKLAEYWTWKANQRLASAICERDEARELADSYRIALCSANGSDKTPNPFPWETKP
jgi:hypothetical protein